MEPKINMQFGIILDLKYKREMGKKMTLTLSLLI